MLNIEKSISGILNSITQEQVDSWARLNDEESKPKDTFVSEFDDYTREGLTSLLTAISLCPKMQEDEIEKYDESEESISQLCDLIAQRLKRDGYTDEEIEEKVLQMIGDKADIKGLLEIEKSKVYFKPNKGEKPPKGYQAQKGPKGGYYYESASKDKPISAKVVLDDEFTQRLLAQERSNREREQKDSKIAAIEKLSDEEQKKAINKEPIFINFTMSFVNPDSPMSRQSIFEQLQEIGYYERVIDEAIDSVYIDILNKAKLAGSYSEGRNLIDENKLRIAAHNIPGDKIYVFLDNIEKFTERVQSALIRGISESSRKNINQSDLITAFKRTQYNDIKLDILTRLSSENLPEVLQDTKDLFKAGNSMLLHRLISRIHPSYLEDIVDIIEFEVKEHLILGKNVVDIASSDSSSKDPFFNAIDAENSRRNITYLLDSIIARGDEKVILKLINKLPSKNEVDYSRSVTTSAFGGFGGDDILFQMISRLSPKGLKEFKDRIYDPSDKDVKASLRLALEKKEERFKAIGERAIEKFITGEGIKVEDFNETFISRVRQLDGKNRDITQNLHLELDELYASTYYNNLHNESRLDWLDSSSSDLAALLKNSVIRQYGGTIRYHSTYGLDDYEEGLWRALSRYPESLADEYVVKQKKLTEVLLDIKYPDINELILFRGTCSDEIATEDMIDEEGNYLDVIDCKVKSNPISSWTLKESTARTFAERGTGVIVSVKVPKKDVWSCFLTHSFSGFEHEFIVLSDKDKDGIAKRFTDY